MAEDPRPVLGLDRAAWPADVLEEWAERAAILEYEAKLSRVDAERLAGVIIRRQFNRKGSK